MQARGPRLTRDERRFLLIMIMLAAALWGLFAGISRAHAHDARQPNLDGWYSSLKRPGVSPYSGQGTQSCCSKEDCHETDAEMRGTHWWAKLGRLHKDEGGHLDWVLEDWVPVPDNVVLQKQSNPTGNAVICHSMNLTQGGNHVKPDSPIWCFIPPMES